MARNSEPTTAPLLHTTTAAATTTTKLNKLVAPRLPLPLLRRRLGRPVLLQPRLGRLQRRQRSRPPPLHPPPSCRRPNLLRRLPLRLPAQDRPPEHPPPHIQRHLRRRGPHLLLPHPHLPQPLLHRHRPLPRPPRHRQPQVRGPRHGRPLQHVQPRPPLVARGTPLGDRRQEQPHRRGLLLAGLRGQEGSLGLPAQVLPSLQPLRPLRGPGRRRAGLLRRQRRRRPFPRDPLLRPARPPGPPVRPRRRGHHRVRRPGRRHDREADRGARREAAVRGRERHTAGRPRHGRHLREQARLPRGPGPWIDDPRSWVEYYSTLLSVRPPPGVSPAEVVEKMKLGLGSGQVENGMKLKVYLKEELPERLHYSDSDRIPPIIGMPDEGYLVLLKRSNRSQCGGAHGYDNAYFSMRSIFVGHGPRFRKGWQVPSFENVEVYNVVTAILGIDGAPNDGSASFPESILLPTK